MASATTAVAATATREFRKFDTGHEDVIQDIAADFHGERIATCSADQRIRVWERRAVGGQRDAGWVCTAVLKGHAGIVYKLAWAHPEFGRVLASCSADHKVLVWSEAEGESGRVEWAVRARLVDSNQDVTCVAFGPPHGGLRLAAGSAGGGVRVYECAELTSLATWQLIGEFESRAKGTGCSCLAWCQSPFDPPMIAVGSPLNDGAIRIYEHTEQSSTKWSCVAVLQGHTAPVLDVAWSPNVGRTFHLLASSSRDGSTRIWRVAPAAPAPPAASSPQPGANPAAAQSPKAGDKFLCESTRLEPQHNEAWRVEFNITGTVLACSGDDGVVRLWKISSRSGSWELLSAVQPLAQQRHT